MRSAAGNEEITIASIVIRNGSGLRLPFDNGYVCECLANKAQILYWLICIFRTIVPEVPVSPIFSLQINPLPDLNILVENPIMMMFDVVRCHNYVLPYLWACSLSQDPTFAALSEKTGVQNKQDFTVNDISCSFYDYTLISNNL